MATLSSGYEIRELSAEEFGPLWREHAPKFFDDKSQIFRLMDALNEEEKGKVKTLQARLGSPLQLRLGLFHNGAFVGWCAGHQESSEAFYMRNSAVFPEHRRRGLYSALLTETLRRLSGLGFQRIYSRHSASNNAVIIPKLKAGFTITALEVTDSFGVLVHLTYLPHPLRRKMMEYRVGDVKPDDEIRTHLKL